MPVLRGSSEDSWYETRLFNLSFVPRNFTIDEMDCAKRDCLLSNRRRVNRINKISLRYSDNSLDKVRNLERSRRRFGRLI